MKLTDREFRGLLTIYRFVLLADEPISGLGVENDAALRDLLNDEARARGFDSWVDAFHGFKVES